MYGTGGKVLACITFGLRKLPLCDRLTLTRLATWKSLLEAETYNRERTPGVAGFAVATRVESFLTSREDIEDETSGFLGGYFAGS